jgi:CubicO group peptidase (beta-lactamase class C family)
MTIQDLFRHTSGLTYGQFGDSLVKRAYREANVMDPQQTLAEMVTKLSKLPLAYHPGTTFEYSMSVDVLGRVIEVVSGMPLDQFIAERVTKPLHMVDSGFVVSESQGTRVAQPQTDLATGKRPPMRDVTKPQRFISGGGGMVSTAADYVRFGQMLLNGGQLDGRRFLSPKTIAFMTANHLPPGVGISPGTVAAMGAIAPSPQQGQGFGLGFATRGLLLGRCIRYQLLGRSERKARGGDDGASSPSPEPPLSGTLPQSRISGGGPLRIRGDSSSLLLSQNTDPPSLLARADQVIE